MNHYRQGDVLLIQIPAIPADAQPVPATTERVVVQYGEATGHHHSVAVADAELLSIPGTVAEAERFLQVHRATSLTHQEHGAVDLVPGVYRIVIQREYTPEAPRRVID